MIFLSIIGFLFVSFIPLCVAQNQPQILNINEAKGLLQTILEGIPRVLSGVFDQAKAFFYKHIYPYLKSAWGKIYYYLGQEVEKRKPSIKQEFQKEVNELKDEAVRGAPSLWQRLQDLIH